MFPEENDAKRLKYKHKHPPNIYVWGDISKQGVTQLVMCSGIMNATKYGDILSASCISFIEECYPECHQLYQENDPKRTRKYIQRFVESNHVNWWTSPAESPDLNPIEKMWGSLKTYLRDKHKPKNPEELQGEEAHS